MITRALPDANVLYSRTLRDWLFLLRNQTRSGMFTIHTTEDLVCEVGYSTRRRAPDADGRLIHRLVVSLRSNVDSIITDYPDDALYGGTDLDDRHVHSAAVAGEIDVILTNDRGLLGTTDDRYEVSTPDEFFPLVDDSLPHVVRAVALEQATYWSGRTSARTLETALEQARCPVFAERVRGHLADVLSRPIEAPAPHTLA